MPLGMTNADTRLVWRRESRGPYCWSAPTSRRVPYTVTKVWVAWRVAFGRSPLAMASSTACESRVNSSASLRRRSWSGSHRSSHTRAPCSCRWSEISSMGKSSISSRPSRHRRVRTPFLMPVITETFCTDPPSPPEPDGWSCCLHLVRGRGVETREQVAEGFHVIGWPARYLLADEALASPRAWVSRRRPPAVRVSRWERRSAVSVSRVMSRRSSSRLSCRLRAPLSMPKYSLRSAALALPRSCNWPEVRRRWPAGRDGPHGRGRRYWSGHGEAGWQPRARHGSTRESCAGPR